MEEYSAVEELEGSSSVLREKSEGLLGGIPSGLLFDLSDEVLVATSGATRTLPTRWFFDFLATDKGLKIVDFFGGGGGSAAMIALCAKDSGSMIAGSSRSCQVSPLGSL